MELSLPFIPTNIVEIARWRAKYEGDRLAYTFLLDGDKEKVSYSYRQLDKKARAIATWLQQQQVQSGETVLLLFDQGLDFITAFYGCLYAGVIAVPAYPPEKNKRLQRLQAVVSDAQAKLALSTSTIMSRLQVESGGELGGVDLPWHAVDQVSMTLSMQWKEIDIDSEMVTYLQYSSGSTGNPKGVQITHKNLLDNSEIIRNRLQHTETDVSVSWLPIFHDLGLIGCVIQPMYVGFHAVSLSPYVYVVEPYLWLKAIHDYRATTTCCPNFGFDLCVRKTTPEQREKLDLSCWRVAVNCAEPVRHETLERFSEVFTPYGFRHVAHYPMYGMAETTLFITGGKAETPPTYRRVSKQALAQGVVEECTEYVESHVLVGCGAVGEGYDLKIVNPQTLQECASNQIGEIWVKSASVAKGYWKRNEQTQEDFHAYLAGEGPYLRTGDLGFFIKGEIYIAGRCKDLIIIRGKNYYPQDIEKTVEATSSMIRPGCGAAFSIEINQEESLIIVQEVREEYTAISGANLVRKIRGNIVREHGISPAEVILVHENTILKTSSGKIQRQACKIAYLQGKLSFVYKQYWDKTDEESLIWETNINLNHSVIQAMVLRFIANCTAQNIAHLSEKLTVRSLGLDSLQILRLKFFLEQSLYKTLPMPWFIEDLTVDQLVTKIASLVLKADDDQSLYGSPAKKDGAYQKKYPLSKGQLALWFIHQLTPENRAYHLSVAMEVVEPLDIRLWERAFQVLMDQHPALKTVIRQDNQGVPYQLILEQIELDSLVVRVPNSNAETLRVKITEHAYLPYDLGNDSPLRVRLFVQGEKQVMLISMHHILSDLWSISYLLQEWEQVYQKLQAEDPSSRQSDTGLYVDFVYEQQQMLQSKEHAHLAQYWAEELSGDLPVLSLPLDYERPTKQSFQGAKIYRSIDKKTMEQIKALANRFQTTSYVVLLTLYQLLLSRYSGQDEILVGSPTAGRNKVEFAEVLGYFINPVVIRGQIQPTTHFLQLMKQMKAKVQGAFLHQDFPFSEMVAQKHLAREANLPPLYQAMFVYEQSPMLPDAAPALVLGVPDVAFTCGRLNMRTYSINVQTSQCDLSLMLAEVESNGVLCFQYDTALFKAITIEHMADSFIHLLNEVLQQPDKPIHSYQVISEQEKHLLEQHSSRYTQKYNLSTLHEMFEKQVVKAPDQLAVMSEHGKFTYRELNERANQIAHLLKERGIQTGKRVGICMGRSWSMLAGILAVLKTGATYVPLDPAYPQDRILYTIQDANLDMLLTCSQVEGLLPQGVVEELSVDVEWSMFIQQPKENLTPIANCSDLAYVIYTSGSTGKPKGVAIEHQHAVTMVNWAHDTFTADELQGVLFSTSICFDLSIFEMFVPLTSGGCVILLENALYLKEFIHREKVTLLNTVPSIGLELLRQEAIPTSVKVCNLAGEPLPNQVAQQLYQLGSVKKVYNLYGPSECTTYSTFAKVQKGASTSPSIGYPITNTTTYILNAALQMVPFGSVGELYIGGAGVAKGYLGKDEMTAERFIYHEEYGRLYRTGDRVRFLENGELAYLGRNDSQVKIRGYRIELGEIEKCLSEHPRIQSAAVIVHEDEQGKRLIAYLQVNEINHVSDSEQWREYLRLYLPEYMIPVMYISLDQLPLTPNGKIDRRRLPVPPLRDISHDDQALAPRDKRERVLASIWCQVLGLEQVGIHDHFFELGGDSILILQVIAKCKTFGYRLVPKQFFSHPTVAQLAKVVELDHGKQRNQGDVTGKVSLTPIQKWFFSQKIPNRHNWNQSMIFQLHASVEPRFLKEAIQHIVQYHDVFRLRFEPNKQDWNVENLPNDTSGIWQEIQCQRDALARLEEIHHELENQLHLTEGPLTRLVMLYNSENNEKYLVWIIHHLVVDGVSWRILLDDLAIVYQQLLEGKEAHLPSKTTSFQEWSTLLQSVADSSEILKEKKYWLQNDVKSQMPIDYLDGVNTDTMTETIELSCTPEETQLLLTVVTKQFRAKLLEIFLTALIDAYQQWTGQSQLLVNMEGHGREYMVDHVDLSRTVGWFTTIYPVLLQTEPEKSLSVSLNAVKEQWRAVPQNGIGYGLLRYLSRDAEIETLPESPISFNYLGQFDQMSQSKLLKQIIDFRGPSGCQESLRTHLIDIMGIHVSGKLTWKWIYSKAMFSHDTMRRFAEAFMQALRWFIAQHKNPDTTSFNPSDFPQARIDQTELSKVLSKIKQRKS